MNFCDYQSAIRQYSNYWKYTQIAMQLKYVIEVHHGMFNFENKACSFEILFIGTLKRIPLHYDR